MSVESAVLPSAGKWSRREWALCGALLAATLLIYATRQALPTAAVRVQSDLGLSNEEYGIVLANFGLAFGLGALLFGIVADAVSVRWLYPCVLVAWSLTTIAAGQSESLIWLLVSHFVLGVFQAGHWPCALRTTQRIFPPEQRTLANSLLQVGAPLGAVLSSVLALMFVTQVEGSWRILFVITGAMGLPWAVLWFASVRASDFEKPVLRSDEPGGEPQTSMEETPLIAVYRSRRFALLVLMVISINVCWHYLRGWLPVVLEKELHYTPADVQYLMIGYWLATLAGGLSAGWLVSRLAERGWAVHKARLTVFLGLALITALMAPAAFLPPGWTLVGLILLIGFGSLGQFPIYYSLTQELSARHQGKVGGSLGFVAWLPLYFVNPAVGRLMDQSPEKGPYVFATVGLLPLAAWIALALGWGARQSRPLDAAESGG